MSNCNCYCKTSCAGISIISGIIVAIITAMLTFMGTITITPAFLWVTFGIAVVYLAVSSLISGISNCCNTNNKCACTTMPVYFIGIIGTIFTSLILLGITFAATSVVGAVISGLVLGFFTMIILSTVCLIKCNTNCNNG